MSRLAIVVLVALSVGPSLAQAQVGRAATVLVGLTPQPALMLGRDRAWIGWTDAAAPPRTICTDVLCRPIVRLESCAAPQCPGSGTMVWASEALADVPDWPTDRDGFAAAQAQIYADPSLAPLTPYLQPHPSPPPSPPRFRRDSDDWWRFELLAGVGVATGLLHISAPMWQLDVALGWRLRPREPLEEGLDVLYGTQMGVELRAHVVGNVTGQRQDDLAIFLGLGPGFSFVEDDEPFRLPPLLATLIPELGVVIRTDRIPPAFYFGWSIPAAVLLDDHVGLEARASLLLIDDWYPGDDVELLGSLSVQLLIR